MCSNYRLGLAAPTLHRSALSDFAALLRAESIRNPSVRNLPSWARGRIDKVETGKRTGRKFTLLGVTLHSR